MNRKSLISLTTAAIAVVMAGGANAQETASIASKPNSIGPAIEFSGGGTSFGIKGKIGVGSQFSVRPTILFGYTPSVSGGTFGQALTNGVNNLTALVAPTTNQQIVSVAVAQGANRQAVTAALAKKEEDRTADENATIKSATDLLGKTEPSTADKAIIDAAKAPVFRYTQFTQSQLAAQLSAFSGVPLTDAQADEFAKQLVAASNVKDGKFTPEQDASLSKSRAAIARYDIKTFKNLTPAQQQILVKSYQPNSTDKQVADTVTALKEALNADTPTSAQSDLLATAQTAVRNNSSLTGFKDLNSTQQRDLVQSISQTQLTQKEVDDSIANLNAAAAALQIPEDKRTADQKAQIAAVNQTIGIQSNSLTPGFTPGSGTAYGLAVTYDFQSADSKLSGYVGPRVMFANGSSKIGNFDTSTSETSIGLLAGADYAISNDLTAGLSATYNFSKSGTLSVTGPGGFSGSAPVSGSSLDIGVSVGYRF